MPAKPGTSILLFGLVLSAFCVTVLDRSSASAQTAPANGRITQGQLRIRGATGLPGDSCPLKHTDVKAEVSGFMARVTLTQEFHNPRDEKIEAIYLFPLPQRSAVDQLTMEVGGRVIRGEIKRREEAQQLFARARTEGRVAALLDQERPNLFTQAVTNIPPGATVKVTISYLENLFYEDGAYEFTFPMTVGPRYLSGQAKPSDGSNGEQQAAARTDQVPDAARLTAPQLPAGMRPGHDISIEVAIDTGVPLEQIQSELHEIEVGRDSGHQAVVRLKEEAAIPDRDFTLRFGVGGLQIADAVLAHRDERGGYFTLMLQPPARAAAEEITPKELVFVLDTSGSMNGLPIETAKRVMQLALDGLYEHDTFNLITFAGETHILFDKPVPATQENRQRAKQLLDRERGDGGTEMMKAIRAALADTDTQDHIRIVCFLTDGQVGNDLQILGEIRRHPKARVFSFGIGNSVNRFLLDRMAEQGRGEAEYVFLNRGDQRDAETAAGAARRFYERVRSPLLTDISVDWNGLPVEELYPRRLPDLFGAKPLFLVGRYTGGASGVIRLRGKVAGVDFIREIQVRLPEAEARHEALASLWARARIDDLMAQDYGGMQSGKMQKEIEAEITRLGLDYRLMTQFTSFIAIDEIVTAPGEAPQRIAVPQAAPDGTATYSRSDMAETASVQTDCFFTTEPIDAEIVTEIQGPRLTDLPLNTRQPAELSRLAPGAAPAPTIVSMGLRAKPESLINERHANVTLEGADLTNDVTGGTLATVPLDALNEMKITTFGVKPEQGRTSTAAIRLGPQTGTGDWHGTASFFHRGDRWSARPATFDRSQAAPSFDRSQSSGALGGPVVKGSLFWFGSFEYWRQHSPLPTGERDLNARTIRNGLSATPQTSTLGLLRVDWALSHQNRLGLLYTTERSEGAELPALQRPLASASQRQRFDEEFDLGSLTFTRVLGPTALAEVRLGFSGLRAASVAASNGLQLDFPDLQAGAPFRTPALPRHDRWQLTANLSKVTGNHSLWSGIETQRISAEYALGFGSGSIEFAENFASIDRNGDGRIDDDDLLIAVTLRNVSPQARNAYLRNTHLAAFTQDDWRIRKDLTLNLGLRWQFDTNEKNLNGEAGLNPLLRQFRNGERRRDGNNFAPRAAFAWSFNRDRFVIRGGYSLLFDRIPLQYGALEQALDGRHTIIEAIGGRAWPNAPGIYLLDNSLQNPIMQQTSLEWQWSLAHNLVARAGYLHNFGSHLLLGRSLGAIVNPLTGSPDRVVNLESSGKSKYDALNLSVEKRLSERGQLLVNYTLSKSFNYANGDQLPFFAGPADPNNQQLEYGPSSFDRRHRFSLSGQYQFPLEIRAAAFWTMAAGAPLDILLPDASARLPLLQRNAGGRLFRRADELNRFIASLNAAGGVNGVPLPLVAPGARFNDRFQSFDLRLTKRFRLRGNAWLELGGESFNLFNVTNILGWSNYSGRSNALVRDSGDPRDPGFLKSTGFGRPLTTAGRLFTAGGPRSLQLVAKFSF